MEAELKRTVTRALHRPPLDKPRREGDHTLRYPFAADIAWAAARYLRTPSRVLWEIAPLRSPRLESLFAEVRALAAKPNAPWLDRDLGISVSVGKHVDFPASPLQIRGTVKNALLEGSQDGGRPLRFAPDDPDLMFVVRGGAGGIRLSLDLGAGSLHQRGYRRHIGPAPLKETLAAQLLILSRWDPRREALVDPMAGAGTIALEAALMASGEPLGRASAALDQLPIFRSHAGSAAPPLFADTRPTIIAGEPDSGSFRALVANARAANLQGRVQCVEEDFRGLFAQVEQPPGGLLVVNPPYGERMGGEPAIPTDDSTTRSERTTPDEDEAVEQLHRDLLDWYAELGPEWRMGVLTTHNTLDAHTPRRCRMKKPLRNGPIKAWFWLFGD